MPDLARNQVTAAAALLREIRRRRRRTQDKQTMTSPLVDQPRQITIGRRVHYLLTEAQAIQINDWRAQAIEHPCWTDLSYQLHVGGLVIEGDVVALDVTRVVTNGQINGRALLDGNDVLWVTGVYEGSEPGTWQWPPRKRE